MARTLRPDLAVILITGHAAATPAEQEAMASDFQILRKPFTRETLLKQINYGTRRQRNP